MPALALLCGSWAGLALPFAALRGPPFAAAAQGAFRCSGGRAAAAAARAPMRQVTSQVEALVAQEVATAPILVLTWNVLAPVYFRGTGNGVEALQPEHFLSRNDRILAAIAESKADVVCLQEHWFSPVLMKLYNDRLSALGFKYEALRRTARNCDGRTEDGIAIFVREASLKIVRKHEVKFHDYGIPQDRVALLLTLEDVRHGVAPEKEFAVMCTHLTYPHSAYDVEARRRQIGACLKAAHAHLPDGMPVVVAGDLNGPSDDNVASHLKGQGYLSAWDAVHGRACSITHTDHRGNAFASDHIWTRGGLRPQRAVLLPEHVPDDRPLLRPTVGGVSGRQLLGKMEPVHSQPFEDWCELSDHRPLMVALAWHA